MKLREKFEDFLAQRWWDMGLLVGLAVALMVYTRFVGLGDPYIKAFDPYLFWRIAQKIWSQGFWPGPDPLRYFPYGWDSHQLNPAVSYSFVLLGRLAGNLKAAVKFYPAFFGILSVVAMGLLGRKLGSSGISAVILSIIPSYMYRTAQGFADKEPMAFFLGILSWYFTTNALDEKDQIWAVYAGIALGMIAAVWGGKLLFAMALVPAMAVLALKEDTERVAVLSTILGVHVLLQGVIPRYSNFIRDPVSLAILGMAAFGYLLHFLYQMPALKKHGRNRLWLAGALGAVAVILLSAVAFGRPTYVIDKVVQLAQAPTSSPLTVSHSQTVAENQRANWTWKLGGNQFWSQMGIFFFLGLSALVVPIIRKAKSIGLKEDAEAPDYVYAGGMVIAVLWLFQNFPFQMPLVLFLLALPQLIEEDWQTIFIASIVAFSFYASFAAIRLLIFASMGAVLGTAYVLRRSLEGDWLAAVTALGVVAYPLFISMPMYIAAGILVAGAAYYKFGSDLIGPVLGCVLLTVAILQVYPNSAGYARSLGGSSLTTTWFENAKWMDFNVPDGEPVVTWWDYGYWLQTLGNTTSLGDGGNVGPGYTLNWYTGNFFSQDDYENATRWLDDWNLTYITIDAQMLPKYWAYSTLGGRSNQINQINYQGPRMTQFGQIPIYAGYSDDFGPVVVGELTTGDLPVYAVGKIVGGRIGEWIGYVGEYSYFSNQGSLTCLPIGYCNSTSFGQLKPLEQSAVVYPQQVVLLGDYESMHSTFARLWFFNGYNTDFELLLNNGETKTFKYVPAQ